MDPFTKDTDTEDFDIGEVINKKLLLKNSCQVINWKDLLSSYKPSFLRYRRAQKSYI